MSRIPVGLGRRLVSANSLSSKPLTLKRNNSELNHTNVMQLIVSNNAYMIRLNRIMDNDVQDTRLKQFSHLKSRPYLEYKYRN